MSRLENKRHLVTVSNPMSPISESYRAIRTNIDFSSTDKKIKVISATSAGPGEGKSTTIGNMAVTFAQSDRKTILIDADMRKPTEHHTFQLSNRWGLSSYLSQQCSLEDAIQETEIPNLFAITAGFTPPNPSEMVSSNRMTELIETLKNQFDMVLIDTPPLLAVTDAQIISTLCDGVILVIDFGKVKKDIAVKAKASLDQVNARILGVVLNNVKRNSKEEYYYYYGSKS